MLLPLLLVSFPPAELAHLHGRGHWRSSGGGRLPPHDPLGAPGKRGGLLLRPLLRLLPCSAQHTLHSAARHISAHVQLTVLGEAAVLLFLHSGKERPLLVFLCVQWWEERKLSILSNWLLFVCW